MSSADGSRGKDAGLSATDRAWCSFCLPELGFIFRMYALFLGIFLLFRIAFLIQSGILSEGTSALEVLLGFLVGMRFDLAVSSYLLAPVFLLRLGSLPKVLPQAAGLGALALTLGAGLADLEFFRRTGMRFTPDLFHSPWRVLSIDLISGWRLVVGVGGLAAGAYLHFGWGRRLTHLKASEQDSQALLLRTMGFTVVLAVMVILSRGGLNHMPLRWKDANFSSNPLVNQISRNALFAMGRGTWERIAEVFP